MPLRYAHMPGKMNRDNFLDRGAYGPNFDGPNFSPLIRNIRTGKLLTKSHHGSNGARTREDFDLSSSHASCAYCLVWIDITTDGKPDRGHCGEVFTIKSDGCGRHPTSQLKEKNPNWYIKPMMLGQEFDWSVLKDPNPIDVQQAPEQAVELSKEAARTMVEDNDAAIEEELSANGYVESDQSQFYKEIARMKLIDRRTRKEQKAQQMTAARDLETATKKGKNKTRRL